MLKSKMQFTLSRPQLIAKNQGQVIIDFRNLRQQNFDCEALIILNHSQNLKFLQYFFDKAQIIVLADGGANQIYKSKLRDSPKITAIIGDFDSIDKQVLQYYQLKGRVQIKKIEDQDACDMQKSLQYIYKAGFSKIICFGSFGGRMDHTLHHISLAQKYCDKNEQNEIMLSGQDSLLFFLKPNINYIINIGQIINSNGCGIMTFEKNCDVQTKGFKWDMGVNYPFSQIGWGKFQSTSNAVQNSQVQIKCTNRAVFICNLR